MALTENMVNCLQYIEQIYWENGIIPDNAVVGDVIGIAETTVANYWKDEQFREAIKRRGIDMSTLLDGPKILSIQQLDVVSRVLNTSDKRSLREKLDEVGVSPQQYSAWQRQPAFYQYMKKRAEGLFDRADVAANMTTVKAIENGDMNATKLYFEMTGKYSPKMQLDVNVEVILTRVIEIIAKHVQSPAILAAIASDFEELEGGRSSARPMDSRPMELELPPLEEIIEATSTATVLSEIVNEPLEAAVEPPPIPPVEVTPEPPVKPLNVLEI